MCFSLLRSKSAAAFLLEAQGRTKNRRKKKGKCICKVAVSSFPKVDPGIAIPAA